jgi:hypothetical protein
MAARLPSAHGSCPDNRCVPRPFRCEHIADRGTITSSWPLSVCLLDEVRPNGCFRSTGTPGAGRAFWEASDSRIAGIRVFAAEFQAMPSSSPLGRGPYEVREAHKMSELAVPPYNWPG